jgi:hypothetical protein
MAKKKMCEICGANPATVPDRERIGRLINRVCGSCHAARLRGDMKIISWNVIKDFEKEGRND